MENCLIVESAPPAHPVPFAGLLGDRKQARAAGHKVYYRLGFKCLKGHQAPRRVSDGACTACIQAEKDKVRAAVVRAVEKAKAPERARKEAERAAKERAKEEAQDARREELKAAREERKKSRTAAKRAATVAARRASSVGKVSAAQGLMDEGNRLDLPPWE